MRERRHPPWLRVKLPAGADYRELKHLLRQLALHTVCEEAHCPNRGECWGQRTVTFLLLGDVCTRRCGFCNVKTGRPRPVDEREPERIAQAVARLGLHYVVLTSVNRDDLPDGGAHIFAASIRRLRQHVPECRVEVLIPDFKGDPAALRTVLEARPDVLGHNVETVPRLFPLVQRGADYQRTLTLLRRAGEWAPEVPTKSGFLVGLGEREEECLALMRDLRAVGVSLLTIGQYLRPTPAHLPVVRYYHPDEFAALREEGLRLGFAHVEAGPLVRSSYHAAAQARSVQPSVKG